MANQITHTLSPGNGFTAIGFRREERRGQTVILLRQATSWIIIPADAWDDLAAAIDDELADDHPELGRLFSSGTNAVRPSQWQAP